MSVEFYRESPGKFDSRTLSRETLSRWTGRTRKRHPPTQGVTAPTAPRRSSAAAATGYDCYNVTMLLSCYNARIVIMLYFITAITILHTS